MSKARYTELKVTLNDTDISEDINKYLTSLTYTDNEEGKADDLQIKVDNKDGIWTNKWMKKSASVKTVVQPQVSIGWNKGDTVMVTGRPHYTSCGGKEGYQLTNYVGKITHLNLKAGVPYPIHIDYKGWFAESQVTKQGATQAVTTQQQDGIKGSTISAKIIQHNWMSENSSQSLNCGEFEIDDAGATGPPDVVTIKATALPYTSTARNEKRYKTWENIDLQSIASELAAQNGLQCVFDTIINPFYTRKQQDNETDIAFLYKLCQAAGIALKTMSKKIILFDAITYESKSTTGTITKGGDYIDKYEFNTTFKDTAYAGCHVTYTDPKTKQTFDYTYMQPYAGTGEILEINQKVTSQAEAEQLAKTYLRLKNKNEATGNITLMGNTGVIASDTKNVKGWGAFDGKYIVQTAVHTVTSAGYTTKMNIRKVLEGY